MPLFADSELLDDWYRENARAERYVAVRDDLTDLFDEAASADIPASLMIRFVREGALKRVAPDQLRGATEAYLARLLAVRDVLEETGWWSQVESEKPVDVLSAGNTFLETDAGADSLRELIENASTLQQVREVLLILPSIYRVDPLDDRTLRQLGLALLHSELTPGSYSSVASLYVQSRARDRSATSVVEAIRETLAEGGGLLQLRRALELEGR